MKVTNDKETQGADEKCGTKYGWITKYEVETGDGLGNNDMGSMKNFPRAFIPMKELSESPFQG
jgi:hypothetical protein